MVGASLSRWSAISDQPIMSPKRGVLFLGLIFWELLSLMCLFCFWYCYDPGPCSLFLMRPRSTLGFFLSFFFFLFRTARFLWVTFMVCSIDFLWFHPHELILVFYSPSKLCVEMNTATNSDKNYNPVQVLQYSCYQPWIIWPKLTFDCKKGTSYQDWPEALFVKAIGVLITSWVQSTKKRARKYIFGFLCAGN